MINNFIMFEYIQNRHFLSDTMIFQKMFANLGYKHPTIVRQKCLNFAQ